VALQRWTHGNLPKGAKPRLEALRQGRAVVYGVDFDIDAERGDSEYAATAGALRSPIRAVALPVLDAALAVRDEQVLT